MPRLTLGEFYDIDTLARAGSDYFFSDGTMRFFNTRLMGEVWPVADGWLFATSEKGPSGIRAYSIRKMGEAGNVSTVGGFQQYSTRRAAIVALRKMAAR